MRVPILAAIGLLAFGFAAFAQGTPDEAKALAERAAAHMRAVGAEQAIIDFNNPSGGFVDRDLFVVIYDPQHIVLTGVPALIGRDATRFVDADGTEFGNAIINKAETEGAGWVQYRMTNPVTKKIQAKMSYVVKVGVYIAFVGAYSP